MKAYRDFMMADTTLVMKWGEGVAMNVLPALCYSIPEFKKRR